MFVDMFPLGSKVSGLHTHTHGTGNTTPTDIMNVASDKEMVCTIHMALTICRSLCEGLEFTDHPSNPWMLRFALENL